MSREPHHPFALVINTSVVRAAGTSDKPTSRNCRETLKAVEEQGYRIAMCRELGKEWRQPVSQRPPDQWSSYASRYAVEWYVRMQSQGRVVWTELPPDSPLRRRVNAQAQKLWPGIRAVEKDFFLVELALLTDRRVISLNNKQREQFSQIAEHVPDLSDVLWLNPDQENVPEWLRNGAPDIPQYRLGLFTTKDTKGMQDG